MRDYPTLHLDSNYSKGTAFLLLKYISQSHFKVGFHLEIQSKIKIIYDREKHPFQITFFRYI